MNPLPSEQSTPDESSVALAARAGKKAPTSKRSLLNKARQAQNKDPLPVSANDPMIDPAATPHAQVSPNPPQLATGVIPPDLMDSWDGTPPEDSEPAGMPDLDDGYLDSLVEGEASIGSPPAISADPPPSPDRPAQRPAPALAFARAAAAGATTAPAAGRGFGFSRSTPPMAAPARANPSAAASSAAPAAPAAPAAAVRGFAPVRRVAAAPTQPLGFGTPARLSTEQARINGQNQDFAKLFDEPRYDADGAPVTYPKPDVWPHDDIPAGSRYSREEWAGARAPDQELPAGHVVVELQIGNPVTSALIKVPRNAPGEASAPPVARTRVVDGKVVKIEPYRGIDDPLADAIADTIVVSRKSPIAAEVRGAVEGGIEITRGGVSSYFRFIRPRAHYNDPDKFLYINSKLQMTGSFGEADARMVAPAEAGADEAAASEAVDQQENEAMEAPRE